MSVNVNVSAGTALDLFRRQGFAATSLDDLSEATGMNRPSLYGAFGDKRELYIKSYQRYREEARASMAAIFREEMPLRQRLERIFASALNIYLSGETGPRGCFTVVTAASEAVSDPEIRAMVLDGLTELDKAFASCFRRAKEKGELPESADPAVLAPEREARPPDIPVGAVPARPAVPKNRISRRSIVSGGTAVEREGRLEPDHDGRRRSMDTSKESEPSPMKNRTKVERRSERELVVTRTFNGPARIVFEAWTKPELFKQWWVPKSVGVSLLSCEMDVRNGGKYRLVFGNDTSNPMAFFGRYIEVTPHSRVVWTNEEGGEGGAVTTVTFEEKGGQTLLVMSDLYPSKEALDGGLASGSVDAMPEAFAQLDELLVTPGASVGPR